MEIESQGLEIESQHFTAVSLAWWSWQAVLNFGHISKLKNLKIKIFQKEVVTVVCW